MKDILTAGEARRIALAAQGFGGDRSGAAGRRQLLRLIERLGVVQIDSVNVVSRTHYLPAFSRLGAYPRELLEDIAWGRKRALFEYWAHEASLVPVQFQPFLRWRMDSAADTATPAFFRSSSANSTPRVEYRLQAKISASSYTVRSCTTLPGWSRSCLWCSSRLPRKNTCE